MYHMQSLVCQPYHVVNCKLVDVSDHEITEYTNTTNDTHAELTVVAKRDSPALSDTVLV
jgi:hypothetical protein